MARAEKSSVARSIEESLHWQRFHVPFEYPVYFTEGLLATGNGVLAQAVARIEPDKKHRCLIFIDDGLVAARPGVCDELVAYATHHAERMELVAAPIQVPGGEVIKEDLHFVERMQGALYDNHIDRHSFCIGIGGGAVLDAVGLVAATTHRGVRHIRIPTTVLSQNDSGVGVKNGINLFQQKNFVGAFAPPFAVLNDIAFIDTLAPRDRIAGMAEAVKVGLIRDGKFFAWLERNADALVLFERPVMARMIRRCAELHMHQIAHGGDPFEMGSARPLDYGHWAAHKLESLTRHHLRHGEAVAIGIALDSRYSVLSGHLEAGEEERICFLLEHLGFKLWHAALDQTTPGGRPAVLQGLQDFREHLGGELSVTLLDGVGTGVEVHEMDEKRILEAIEWLRQRGAG
jgi:3-dehydroquinate synthase